MNVLTISHSPKEPYYSKLGLSGGFSTNMLQNYNTDSTKQKCPEKKPCCQDETWFSLNSWLINRSEVSHSGHMKCSQNDLSTQSQDLIFTADLL